MFPENKGGIERWYEFLSRKLVDNGFQVTYLNMQGINEIRHGVNFESLTADSWEYIGDGKRSIYQSIKYAKSIKNWLLSNTFDVAYISSVPIIHLSLIRMKSRLRKSNIYVEWFEYWSLKYWIGYSGIFPGTIASALQKFGGNVGDKIVFTQKIYDRLSKRQMKKMNQGITLLPGLIPIQKINEIDLMQNFARNDICFLGRFVSEKQPLEAIRYISSYIQRTNWSGNFWIIGTGPLEMQMRKLILELNQNRQMHILSGISDSNVGDKLQSSFALFHPSKREGYGIAMFEAANLLTPTILIDFPENASVDITPIPRLVCSTNSSTEVLEKIDIAYKEQKEIRSQLDFWRKSSEEHSMAKSVEILISIFNSKNTHAVK